MNPAITRAQFPFWHTIEVRWGDMDALGHVNNAVYFRYCESARIALLRGVNIRGRAEGGTQGPTLVTTSCDFKREVKYPATLEVGVRVEAVTRRSFAMQYALFFAGTDELVAVARSVNAWVDYAARQAVEIPDELRAALAAYQTPPA
jgi:acyl-CoA thioester hydrolase